MATVRVLLQTTIPFADDDWHVGRFSLLLWPNYRSGRNGDVQRVTPAGQVHPLLRSPPRPGGVLEWLPSHPHEGSVGVSSGHPTGRVVATGQSKATGRPFNLIVTHDAGSERSGAGAPGRWIAESSFHHFADYNWDTARGAPSFVTEPTGDEIARAPSLLDDVRTYVSNIVGWLSPEASR
ncbi:MAG TPA: hypothetical protein VEL05_09100 [Candidatus Acidoferrum sp.]|nr:hypothetical protein [Candidatus Acidoferrum sp.]